MSSGNASPWGGLEPRHLIRPVTWDGDDSGWKEFRFAIENYFTLIKPDMIRGLEAAAIRETEIQVPAGPDDEANKVTYAVLASSVEGVL